jgi:D-alanyl-lipoteichoic acid acyltransferase DltB (MBOAT superfamily)
MATMLIGGLWHGAAWSFVIWGGLHGAWLAIGRYRREHGLATDAATGWTLWWKRIITFNLVCFAWIFFRAGSENGLSTAWDVIARLFDNWGAPSPLVTGGVILAIVVGIATQYLPARIPQAIMAWFSRRQVAVQIVVLAFALMVSRTMGPQGVAPFIYFQF